MEHSDQMTEYKIYMRFIGPVLVDVSTMSAPDLPDDIVEVEGVARLRYAEEPSSQQQKIGPTVKDSLKVGTCHECADETNLKVWAENFFSNCMWCGRSLKDEPLHCTNPAPCGTRANGACMLDLDEDNPCPKGWKEPITGEEIDRYFAAKPKPQTVKMQPKRYPCPYDAAIECDMRTGCAGCEDFEPISRKHENGQHPAIDPKYLCLKCGNQHGYDDPCEGASDGYTQVWP